MTLGGHVIMTGGDGRLSGMTPLDVEAIVDQALPPLGSTHPNRPAHLILHFHGGLVNQADGTKIAESLLPVYQGAGADPLFFVWQAGAGEIIRNNLLEIAREELFDKIVRRVLGWAVGAVRTDVSGTRIAGTTIRPTPVELDTELRNRRRTSDPELGQEPFAAESEVLVDPDPGRPFELTAQEEALFLAEVETDPQLRTLIGGALAAQDLTWLEGAGGRGVPDAPPIPSRMDPEVLAQIAAGDAADSRGPFSTVVLARKALQVLRAVLQRYRTQTDSGVYPTVVEEVLRAFYLANVGGALWAAMKRETQDSFAAADRGGRLVLDRLAARLAERPDTRITLVGHSTGAVFINNLLTAIARERVARPAAWPKETSFQVIFLAPACTSADFAAAREAGGDLIGRFRMFTMSDAAERADHLVGAVYPRSLLYLVSGLLERDRDSSALAPVLGLSRYLAPTGLDRLLASELARTAHLDAVRSFLAVDDRVVLSPTAVGAPDGGTASALKHGDFDDDEQVRLSLVSLIRSWSDAG